MLADAMHNAERVESAHHYLKSSGNSKPSSNSKATTGGVDSRAPACEPIEIRNVQLRKLTQEEPDTCTREGPFLRCTGRKSAQKAGGTGYRPIH